MSLSALMADIANAHVIKTHAFVSDWHRAKVAQELAKTLYETLDKANHYGITPGELEAALRAYFATPSMPPSATGTAADHDA